MSLTWLMLIIMMKQQLCHHHPGHMPSAMQPADLADTLTARTARCRMERASFVVLFRTLIHDKKSDQSNMWLTIRDSIRFWVIQAMNRSNRKLWSRQQSDILSNTTELPNEMHKWGSIKTVDWNSIEHFQHILIENFHFSILNCFNSSKFNDFFPL